MPDEQKRLTVTADARTGIPARRLAMRATFMPCSASGIAQPMISRRSPPEIVPGALAQRLGNRRRAELVRGACRAASRSVAFPAAVVPLRRSPLHAFQSPNNPSIASATSATLPSNR